MATNGDTPKRELTPVGAAGATPRPGTPPISLIPQKRALVEELDHTPAVRSPLNPDSRPSTKTQAQAAALEETQTMAREKRTKKDSLKKRESKGVPTPGAGGAGVDSARATPDPKQKDPPLNLMGPSPIRYTLAGPLRPSDFEQTRGPVLTSHHKINGPDGEEIEFFETSEQPLNRRGYVYNFCIADPRFTSSLCYRQTEPPPHTAHLSFEDAAQHMYLDEAGMHVTGDHGFRMARANVGVRQGRWFWECKVTRGVLRAKDRKPGGPEARGHVRIGWARREASRDAPVGFDAYSYAIRDVSGQKVHMSRPKDFFPPGEDVREGDVIGLEICLPSESLHRKVVTGAYNPAVDLLEEQQQQQQQQNGANGARTTNVATATAEAGNIVRDRVPFRFKAHMIYFERFEAHPTKECEDLMNPSPAASTSGAGADKPSPHHPVPCLRTLPNSYIRIYKNGRLMGTPFEDLLAFLPPASTPNSKVQEGAREGFDDGMLGYYPAVSVFRGGAAEVNFGPKFWYPPAGFGTSNTSGGDDGDVEMADADASAAATATAPDFSASAAGSVIMRPIMERFDEQIVEDIVWDIVDEVDYWMQDEARLAEGIDGGSVEERREAMQEDP